MYMELIRNLIKGIVYKTAPIKQKRIVFSSLNGQYSDSPKAISSTIKSLFPEYQIVWLVNNSIIHELPENYVAIDIKSIKAAYYAGSASIVIDNVYAENAVTIYENDNTGLLRAKIYLWLRSKKKQNIYSTWHGSPIKRMGIDQVNSRVKYFLCNRMTMVLGDQYTLDIMRRLTFNKMEMKLLGTPRNDILFSNNVYSIKKKLNIIGKKVILFAPTFRNKLFENDDYLQRSGLNQIEKINFNELLDRLSKKFGGDWIFICRFHYHVAEKVDWDKIYNISDGKVINGNILQDMADYLACADVLLSDISSCMFDFALTEKPCFCFFPDRTLFENNERGLYVNLESLPFPIAEDYNTLIDEIIHFDDENYRLKVKEFKKKYGLVDDGHSAERFAIYITEQDKHNADKDIKKVE